MPALLICILLPFNKFDSKEGDKIVAIPEQRHNFVHRQGNECAKPLRYGSRMRAGGFARVFTNQPRIYTCFNACFISSIRTSVFSIPAESLTVFIVTPKVVLLSAGIYNIVVRYGIQIRDSVAPKLTA